ncbi:arsenite methyltransferase [Bacteroidota bacterium]
MEQKNLKEIVKEKYAAIAKGKINPESSCCSKESSCCEETFSVMKDDYDQVEGYYKEADLSLGCGVPTEYAQIKPGHHVLDLGSGAGNDCFVARSLTGPEGKVVGLDFTENMIAKAKDNTTKLGYDNVEFVFGDIENMPFETNSFDVIISNCVLNLVPDKKKAFEEMHRVQKPGGHFSVSDIVLVGELPDNIRKDAEMYAGCVAGAIQQSEYINLIEKAGYKNITIQKTKKIEVPRKILLNYMNDSEISTLMEGNNGIFSITVFGKK